MPLAGPAARQPGGGRYYDWPVGFRAGLNLRDFWQLEESKPGETTFTHFPDGTAHKNRMQGNDFVQSAMYATASPARAVTTCTAPSTTPT